MMIFIHALVGFAILMIGSDFAAIDGRKARELALPGAEITPFIPWIAVGLYALAVVVTRRRPNRWTRVGGIVAGYILASVVISYPNWIFQHFSHKINISEFVRDSGEFLPAATVADFRIRFNTPTVQYSASHDVGPWLVVPARKYSESMLPFLRDQKNKAEQSAAPIPRAPRTGHSDGAR